MISIGRQYGAPRQWSRSITRSAARKLVLSIRSQGTASCHHPVHAEQQSIVGMARIIDPVLVDDDRGDQSTELDQHMPVAVETRALDPTVDDPSVLSCRDVRLVMKAAREGPAVDSPHDAGRGKKNASGDCRSPRQCGPAPPPSLPRRVRRMLFHSTSDSRDFVVIFETIRARRAPY
jgi:hypothetical protein